MITVLFYSEVIVGLTIWAIMYFGFQSPDMAYWISTAHPISRFPVFVMGICGGVLHTRTSTQSDQDYFVRCDNSLLNFIFDTFPLPCRRLKWVNFSQISPLEKSWAQRVDINAAFYIFIIGLFSLISFCYKLHWEHFGAYG